MSVREPTGTKPTDQPALMSSRAAAACRHPATAATPTRCNGISVTEDSRKVQLMRKLLLMAALALGVGVAQADSGFFYLGAGISKNKVSEITNGGANFADIDNTSW